MSNETGVENIDVIMLYLSSEVNLGWGSGAAYKRCRRTGSMWIGNDSGLWVL